MPGEQGNWTDGIVVKQRYTIASLLGKGGMGEVYRAWDGDLRTDVVIKVPLPETMKSAEFVERFEREIRSLVKLAHPHIVRITDCGSHRGLPYAVMQFLTGGSLKDRYEETPHTLRPAPPEELDSWLPGVASALDFIHKQGFVHRDVKPANILFDGHGNPYLSDFGIAKVHAENSAGMTKGLSLTAQNMVLGTPEYMAPELIMGRGADGRVDQYALAVTVYEVLCGQCPFQGQPTAILVMHTGMQPPPMSQFASGISPAVEDVVQRAMAKSPDDRYPDCASFARAISEAVRAGVRPARATMMEARVPTTQAVPGFAPATRTAPPPPPRTATGAPPRPSGSPTQSWGHSGSATVTEMSTLAPPPPSHISLDELPTSLAPPPPAPARPRDRTKLLWAAGIAGTLHAMAGAFFLGKSGGGSSDAPRLTPQQELESAPLAAADEKASFTNSLGMRMVAIRPGRYAATAGKDATQSLMAGSYWIAAHEVTVAQYFEFLNSKELEGKTDHQPDWFREHQDGKFPPRYAAMGLAFRQNGAPIVGITQADADAFCRWLTAQESKSGLTYRLPTRSEWLCAARAGTSTRFPWGDDVAAGKFNGGGSDDGQSTLAVTGQFPASAWGLFDMLGNAQEMVTDSPGLAGGGWQSESRENATPDHFEPLAAPSLSAGFRVVAVPK